MHYLVPGSKAEECGNIRPGDRMLEVNGKDLRDVTVDEAAALMMVSGDRRKESWVGGLRLTKIGQKLS